MFLANENDPLKFPLITPKHTGLFANLFIPAVDKFVHQLYRDNECSDKQIYNNTFFLYVIQSKFA